MEVWKPVPKIAGCEASSLGRIRLNGEIRPLSLTGKYARVGRGYLATKINGKLMKVHILVCLAFQGEKPFLKSEVNHKSGVTTDNHYTNLEWTTSRNNQLHAIRIGLKIPINGEKIGTAVLTREKVVQILQSPLPSRAAAKMFGISKTQVLRIRRKEAWKHVSAV